MSLEFLFTCLGWGCYVVIMMDGWRVVAISCYPVAPRIMRLTQQSGLKLTEGEKLPLLCTGNEPKPEATREVQDSKNNLDINQASWFHFLRHQKETKDEL